MPWTCTQKQTPLYGRSIKFLTIILGVIVILFLVLSASILSPAFSSHYPFHAQCQLKWTWTENNCTEIHDALVNQVKKWTGPDNCASGGEKCLYELLSDEDDLVILQHTTPVRKFVDTINLSFCDSCKAANRRLKRAVQTMTKSEGSSHCTVSGFSQSHAWYAVFDYGTNYCNMRNLADGAGLTDKQGFKEETGDDVCTQYSTANCDVY